MRRLLLLVGLLSVTYGSTQAQWTVENSGSTADLRGIDNVGNGVVWASGTNGTVLRTEDGGYLLQACTIPPGAERLDFRGIQAFDSNTAIVMSSGKGDLSRLYKTTDGCQTWKLVFTNPDKDGFWDAVRFDRSYGLVLGDPVRGEFGLWSSSDVGDSWQKGSVLLNTLLVDLMHHHPTPGGEGIFAASNSSLQFSMRQIALVAGGPAGSRLFFAQHLELVGGGGASGDVRSLPLAMGSESAGAFSLGPCNRIDWVVVGGDYLRPDDSAGTAAFSPNGGVNWHAAQSPPHGYRSAVAYDAASKTWITVGPNGTDISTDDGKNWRALHPDPALHEPDDADKNWNALSLPFVVGPHGRIGKLNPHALAPETKK
jgi:photosystem II stability/assembly factor-like uncharacterized protein